MYIYIGERVLPPAQAPGGRGARAFVRVPRGGKGPGEGGGGGEAQVLIADANAI